VSASPEPLYSADAIAARLEALAGELAALPVPPQVAAPVLVGAFVFAADLMRALARQGLHLGTEMIWLRSYGQGRTGGEVAVLAAPTGQVSGRHVLVIDGVLDTGRTMARATALLREAGAASVRTVAAVDKRRDDAVCRADHALYTGVTDFIVGYGMDDAGCWRALPYIGKVTD
jgi:hypoxanthine phosphoribosyltransferase